MNVNEVPLVGGLLPEEGWVDMQVQFLIDHGSGAKLHVLGRTVFRPGSHHDIHRHPRGEEFQLLVSGAGVAVNGDEEVPMRPGDVIFTPANEWHGFRNTSPTEDAVLLWGWAGGASREEVGYEVGEPRWTE